ncbi:MAG: hypothetical protein ACFCVK_24580 [Acidimicrobiales bacterium]
MGEYAVVWPRSAKTAELVELAPRLPSLEGATVAFLWDYLFRGDEIFPVLERELSARYPGMTFVPYQEFGTTHGEGEHDMIATMAAELTARSVDAVISGMGC